MREIKFRAWDPRHKVMFVPEVITEYQQAAHKEDEALMTYGGEVWGEPGRIILMQYTGLHDKNGKEIYEGDIIMSPSWWWGPCFVFYASGVVGPCRGENVMEWRLGQNIMEPEDHDIHNLWDGSEVEVIGNIYENPELLEAKP